MPGALLGGERFGVFRLVTRVNARERASGFQLVECEQFKFSGPLLQGLNGSTKALSKLREPNEAKVLEQTGVTARR